MLAKVSARPQLCLSGRCKVAARSNTSFAKACSPLHALALTRRNISAASAATAAPGATKLQAKEYPDPEFCKAVLSAFPAQGTCSAEEARVLYSAEYVFLDVRSAEELDSEGKVLPNMPGVFHAPLVNFAKRYDSALGRKVVIKTKNEAFLAAVQKQVPNKEQCLILACSGVPSQGEQRSAQAMKTLRDAGYKNLVVLDGGVPVSQLLRSAPWSNYMIDRI